MELQIEIANRCPLDCVHCSSKALRKHCEQRKFSNDSLIQFLQSLPAKKQLYLTGGEPLSYTGLLDLCKKLDAIPDSENGLFTSGIRKKGSTLDAIDQKYAEKLRTYGIRNCYISIYGANAASHNRISNADTYDLTCESVKNLNGVGISTHAHVVLMKSTVHHLSEILDSISALGMKSARILRLARVGSADDNWNLIGMTADEQEAAIHEIIEKFEQYPLRVSVSGFPELLPCRPTPNAIGCQRGIQILYITYCGDVYPCACVKGSKLACLGNLNDIPNIMSKLSLYDGISHFPSCINGE